MRRERKTERETEYRMENKDMGYRILDTGYRNRQKAEKGETEERQNTEWRIQDTGYRIQEEADGREGRNRKRDRNRNSQKFILPLSQYRYRLSAG